MGRKKKRKVRKYSEWNTSYFSHKEWKHYHDDHIMIQFHNRTQKYQNKCYSPPAEAPAQITNLQSVCHRLLLCFGNLPASLPDKDKITKTHIMGVNLGRLGGACRKWTHWMYCGHRPTFRGGTLRPSKDFIPGKTRSSKCQVATQRLTLLKALSASAVCSNKLWSKPSIRGDTNYWFMNHSFNNNRI